MNQQTVSVLFICMGNICRSPTAEGVFRYLVKEAGLENRIKIDSAGTHAYHVGEPPDARSQEAAKAKGYDLSTQWARALSEDDCETFDYLITMDADNLANVKELCSSAKATPLLSYASSVRETDVPDPYYGGGRGFERVLELVEAGCKGLLDDITTKYFAE